MNENITLFSSYDYSDPLTMSAQISDDVLSKPFTVYAAKNFPGMTGIELDINLNTMLINLFLT